MKNNQYLARCQCGRTTSKAYARAHDGKCKACAEPDNPSRRRPEGERQDLYHDYIASGAAASGVSFDDC